MEIRAGLDNTAHTKSFQWQPLAYQGKNIYLWDLPEQKSGVDTPVIYRFVMDFPNVGLITIYIGEGTSLNGPAKTNSAHQYCQGSGPTRQRVKSYIRANSTHAGWTELLVLPENDSAILQDDACRKFLQELLIGAYFFEHRILKAKHSGLPDFLNKPR